MSLSKWIVGLVVTGSVVLVSIAGYKNHQARTATAKIQNVATQKESELATIVNRNAKIVYAVDSNGEYNANAAIVTKHLNNWFTTMTTYTSGREYDTNRAVLKNHITDPTFFKKYYRDDKDSSNKSSVDILSLKSQTDSVHSYLTADGSYLVMVRYYMYHHDSDLDHVSALTPSYGAYIVNATQSQMTKIRVINDIAMENQAD